MPSLDKDVVQWEHSHIAGGSKSCTTVLENWLKYLQKVNVDIPSDSSDKNILALIFNCCHKKFPQT